MTSHPKPLVQRRDVLPPCGFCGQLALVVSKRDYGPNRADPWGPTTVSSLICAACGEGVPPKPLERR